MPDTHVHIHFPNLQQQDRPFERGFRMENQHFIEGYYMGLADARHGVNAGVPVTDAEIVDNLKVLFSEPFESAHDEAMLWRDLGRFFGNLTGRW